MLRVLESTPQPSASCEFLVDSWRQTRLGHSLETLVGQEETVNVQRDPRCRFAVTHQQSRLRPECFCHRFGCLLALRIEDVAIDVSSDPDRRVTENSRHDFDRDSLREENRSARVAEFMGMPGHQTRLGGDAVERMSEVCWIEWRTNLAREDEVGMRPRFADNEPLGCLALLVGAE